MSLVVGELVAMIDADLSPFEKQLQQGIKLGENFVKDIGSGLKNIGSGMQSLGGNMTKAITLPLAAAAGGVLKLGSSFESEMAKITGLVGVSEDQVDQWGAKILELGPEIGKTPQELAEALFFVTSAGLKGAEALEVLEMAGKASSAGLGETSVIADLVTSAMNAYGKENLSASQATDILTAAVREGKAEASELAGSMGQVLPLAAEMGVTFDEVAAAQAAMTRTGTGADEAATQLKSIMSGLLKPSKQAEEALQDMGMSSAGLRKQIKERGLLSALQTLREKTNKYGDDAMAKVYPNIRGLMGVLDLMGSNAEDNVDIFESLEDATGSLDEAFDSASNTLDFKWNQSLAQIQSTALGFYDILKSAFLPVLDTLNSVLQKVTTTFSNMSPQMQQVTAVLLAVLAGIGPALTILGTVVVGLGAAFTGLGSIISFISLLIGSVSMPVIIAIGAAIGVIAAMIAAVIAAFVAWGAILIKSYTENEEFRKKVNDAWTKLKEKFFEIMEQIKILMQTVWGIIKEIWAKNGDQIMESAQTAFLNILKIISGFMDMIKSIIKIVIAIIQGDWSGAWNAIKEFLRSAVSTIKTIISSMKTNMSNTFTALKKLAITIFTAMLNRVISLVSKMKKQGKEMAQKMLDGLNSLKTKLIEAGANLIEWVIDGISSMKDKLGSACSTVAQTIRNYLPFSPAKVGPLSDIDKLNFSGPVLESLDRAEDQIKKSALGGLLLKNLDGKITEIKETSNIGQSSPISGNFNFYGIQDIVDFMTELRDMSRTVGGRSYG